MYWLPTGTLGPHSLILTVIFYVNLDKGLNFSEPPIFFTQEEYLSMAETGLLIKHSICFPTLPSPLLSGWDR